jgi:hypothetical protein
MSDARRSQTRAVTAFVAIVLAVGATFAACTSYQRQNGEDCIKDVDCLSNYCLTQVCSAPPPLLVGPAYEGGASEDTGTGGVDSSPGAPDTGSAVDSGSDSGGDSSADGPPAADSAAEPDAADGQASLDGAGDGSDLDAADASVLDASDDADGGSEDANPDGADALFLVSRAELPA